MSPAKETEDSIKQGHSIIGHPDIIQTGQKSHPAGGRDSQEDEGHEEGQHRACEEESEEEKGRVTSWGRRAVSREL